MSIANTLRGFLGLNGFKTGGYTGRQIVMPPTELQIKVTSEGAEQAAEMLERLSFAADKATASLEALNESAHGGVTIKIVGSLCEVIVSPPEYIEVQDISEKEPRKVRVS